LHIAAIGERKLVVRLTSASASKLAKRFELPSGWTVGQFASQRVSQPAGWQAPARQQLMTPALLCET